LLGLPEGEAFVSLLPELEVIRKDLERDVVGKRVKDVTVRATNLVARHRDPAEFVLGLSGQKVGAVARRGVHLLCSLDSDDVLVVRVGEYGTFSRETAAAEGGRNTQLIISFTTGGSLHYLDSTEEGEFFLVPAAELSTLPELSKGGIDPLADTFTWRAVGEELVRRAVPLKTLLVDPTFVVGLGDLYSDEILWAAGLSGGRLSSTLSSQEIRRLYRSLLEVLHEAVKQRTADGVPVASEEGDDDEAEQEDWLKVSGREGLPCLRCRRPIRYSEVADGALSYHCAGCQT
jgi:formamidopyrimidine-DNA glycosylase